MSRGISPLFLRALHNCAESSSGYGSRDSPLPNDAHPQETPQVIEVPRCTLPNGSSLKVKVVYYNPCRATTTGASDSTTTASSSGGGTTGQRRTSAKSHRHQHRHSSQQGSGGTDQRFSTEELRQWLQSEGHHRAIAAAAVVPPPQTTRSSSAAAPGRTPKDTKAAPPVRVTTTTVRKAFQSELRTALTTSSSSSSLVTSSGSLDWDLDVWHELSSDSLGYQMFSIPACLLPLITSFLDAGSVISCLQVSHEWSHFVKGELQSTPSSPKPAPLSKSSNVVRFTIPNSRKFFACGTYEFHRKKFLQSQALHPSLVVKHPPKSRPTY